MAITSLPKLSDPMPSANPHHRTPEPMPSRWRLGYDVLMLVLIVIDLLLMGLDALLMSSFMLNVATLLSSWLAAWGDAASWLSDYRTHWHSLYKTASGFFTLYLVIELLVRWGMAIVQRTYYRWFFFPFVHWYEVLGCAPQLRALRLLRAAVIGYRLHQLGYQILPQKWLNTAKFYYGVLMEEVSDRVILTAIDNIRTEIAHADGHLVQSIIDNHRQEIEQVIFELLQQEVTPLLQTQPNTGDAPFAAALSKQVGVAIQQALMDTPELRRALRLIPIAGSLIESQLMHLGQHIGENLTLSLSRNLTEPQQLDKMYHQIASQLAQVDTTSPALENLVSSIINESLDALAAQVKIQQWKHKAALQHG